MSMRPLPLLQQRVAGALLIVGATLGLVGNALHPHAADLDGSTTVASIAQNAAWVPIHLAIIVAIVLIIGGLVGLTERLADSPGGPVARLGLAGALLGGAIVTVSTAIDGFVMKALSVPPAQPTTDAAEALRITLAVKEVDFGIWSIGMLVLFGAAFACFGVAVVASRRYPRWFGWIAVLGAVGSATAALLQIAAYGEVQAAETIFLISSLVLTLWTLALGIGMWRERDARLAGAPAIASSFTDEPAPAT